MLKEIVASNAAKLIAACVCPVATTAALTVSVPQVRQAVHKATAPRAYAKPKTRVRQPAAAAPKLASALPECPPAVMIGNSTIAPNLAFPAAPMQLASGNGVGPGGGGDGFGPSFFPTGPGPGPGWGGGTNGGPPIDPPPPAVPEPETWVQMLIGFGVIGGATRVTYKQQRRRKPEEADA